MALHEKRRHKESSNETDIVTYSGHSTSRVPVPGCFLGCGLLFPRSQILRGQGESPQVELSLRTLALRRASLKLYDMFILILMPWAYSSAEQGRRPKNLRADPKSQPHSTLSCPPFSYNKLSRSPTGPVCASCPLYMQLPSVPFYPSNPEMLLGSPL